MFTAIFMSLLVGLVMVMAVIHAEAIKDNWEKMITSVIHIFSPKGIAELAREFSFVSQPKAEEAHRTTYEEQQTLIKLLVYILTNMRHDELTNHPVVGHLFHRYDLKLREIKDVKKDVKVFYLNNGHLVAAAVFYLYTLNSKRELSKSRHANVLLRRETLEATLSHLRELEYAYTHIDAVAELLSMAR